MRRRLFCYAYCLFILNHAFLVEVRTSWANAPASELSHPITRRSGRIYDCGANSLFLVCRIFGIDASYKKCLEMLPLTPKGNSMLEMKQALESLGFNVKPLRIRFDEIANLRVPTIMWAYAPKGTVVRKEAKNLGHYLVVIPLDNDTLHVLDYPESPVILATHTWIKHLGGIGVEDIPIILCGLKSQKLSDMFLSKTGSSRTTTNRTNERLRKDSLLTSSQIVIKQDMLKDPVVHWDFGDIAEGSFIKHNFTIINNTDKELHISKLSKGCTCSAVAADKESILPGDSCTVTISISLAGRHSKQSIISAVIFDEKDGVPPVKLLITGNSHARWAFAPGIIDFGLIEFGSEIQKRSVLISATDYGMNSSIANVKCDSDLFTINMIPNPESDDKSCVVNISIDPNKFIGKFEEKIRIFATGQDEPAHFYRVVAEFYSNIILHPRRLFLTPSHSPMGVVHLRQKHGKAINLISTKVVGCNGDKIEITPNNSHGSQELQLAVDVVGDKEKSCSCILQIELNTGDNHKTCFLTIPLFYTGKN